MMRCLCIVLLFIARASCVQDDTVCIDGDCGSIAVENEDEGGVGVVSLQDVEEFGPRWLYHSEKDFFIADAEVTVAQYRECVDDSVCEEKHYDTVSRSGCMYRDTNGNEQMPMNCVDFDGAEQMCEWLGGRVCSEDEWNSACRGTFRNNHMRMYPYGKKFKKDACLVGTYDDRLKIEPVKTRIECVGGLDGLHDMGGSLSEWISTSKDVDSSYRKFKPISFAFNGPVDKHVCKTMCAGNQRDFRSSVIGIRCCRSW